MDPNDAYLYDHAERQAAILRNQPPALRIGGKPSEVAQHMLLHGYPTHEMHAVYPNRFTLESFK